MDWYESNSWQQTQTTHVFCGFVELLQGNLLKLNTFYIILKFYYFLRNLFESIKFLENYLIYFQNCFKNAMPGLQY